MKRKNKIYLRMTILLIIIYIVLLTILFLSEYTDSNATIRLFGDAFWYSLITFTTVGYGDLIPVTLLGHTFCLVSSGRKNGIILQIMEQNLILWLKISMFTPEILEKTYKEYCETKKSEAIQDMYRRLDHALP